MIAVKTQNKHTCNRCPHFLGKKWEAHRGKSEGSAQVPTLTPDPAAFQLTSK